MTVTALAAANEARTAKSHALFARLAEVSKTARTMKEQAKALGVPAKNVKFIRYHARKAGFNLDAETSMSLDAVAMEMAKAGRCRRCSLRGPHLCTTAENMAGFGSAAFADRGASTFANLASEDSMDEEIPE